MNDYYEARQHLNLSQIAFDVVENDKYAFLEKPSFAKMLNTIIEMYRDCSDASIDSASERYRQSLEQQVMMIPDCESKESLISSLVQSYKKKLIATAISYPRECQFKFQLSKENYAYIMEWRDPDNAYDGVPGKFIKAVVEEYARKPLVEREAIVFKDLLELINACIASHTLMQITLTSNARYEVRPYCVCVDKGNNYHYLVGYSRHAGSKEEERLVSYRITNIKAYRMSRMRSGKITETQQRIIKEKIHSVGVQFLLQDPETIRVKLTKRGKNMYDSQAHLRPPFIKRAECSDGNWLFDFTCTPIQAQFYFFKFGSDAEVIEPLNLRELFKKLYRDALSVYQE